MAPETMEKSVLEGKVASELHTIAAGLGIGGHQKLKKAELIAAILAAGVEGVRGEYDLPPEMGPDVAADAKAREGEPADAESESALSALLRAIEIGRAHV